MKQLEWKYAVTFGLLIVFPAPSHASEIWERQSVQVSQAIEKTGTQVMIREHPKTGRPYVSIVSSELPNPIDPFLRQRSRYSRPDYRMLDPKIKSGKIPYEGPYSDRKKVYVLAVSLATLGVAGGAVGMATASTAASTAAGGGGAYVTAGSAVAGTATAASLIKSQPDPEKDRYTHTSESKR